MKKKRLTAERTIILILGLSSLFWGLFRMFYLGGYVGTGFLYRIRIVSNGTEFILLGFVLILYSIFLKQTEEERKKEKRKEKRKNWLKHY
jgi:dolichol kinase